jgi:chloramphenicol 3-O-phosphotransferase
MPQPAIVIITGAPGAGKTSVARALAQRFAQSLHLPVDELRDWVVSGKAEPIPVLTPPAAQQLRLARQAAAAIADLYAQGGFTVVVDDVLTSHDVQALFNASDPARAVHLIFLCPSFAGVIDRNRARYPQFDVQTWEPVIHGLYQDLCAQNTSAAGWIVLDTTTWSIAQTVDTILQQAGLSGRETEPA